MMFIFKIPYFLYLTSFFPISFGFQELHNKSNFWQTFFFVIAKFLWGLGLPENEAECNDVYGLDEALLDMVPKPVLAVLFLYPITEKVC